MWNNMKDVDIYWNRVNGKTPTENTGPTTDHTKGTDAGNYLFFFMDWLTVKREVRYIYLLRYPSTPDDYLLFKSLMPIKNLLQTVTYKYIHTHTHTHTHTYI